MARRNTRQPNFRKVFRGVSQFRKIKWLVVGLCVCAFFCARQSSAVRAIGSEPSGLPEKERRQIEQLLLEARTQPNIGARMKLISERLLGLPYLLHPLKGSVTEPEQLVVRLDGFDCVTFIETVLALSGAADVNGFLDRLRALRYDKAEVSYATRLHYTTDWHAANVRRGYLRDLTQGSQTAERAKVLNAVPGIPARNVTVHYFPKAKLAALNSTWQDGDLIYFVAGRNWLDTNHVGMLFRVDGQLRIRHASHRLGGVVEQSLAEYFATNQMIGFMIARPVESK